MILDRRTASSASALQTAAGASGSTDSSDPHALRSPEWAAAYLGMTPGWLAKLRMTWRWPPLRQDDETRVLPALGFRRLDSGAHNLFDQPDSRGTPRRGVTVRGGFQLPCNIQFAYRSGLSKAKSSRRIFIRKSKAEVPKYCAPSTFGGRRAADKHTSTAPCPGMRTETLHGVGMTGRSVGFAPAAAETSLIS